MEREEELYLLSPKMVVVIIGTSVLVLNVMDEELFIVVKAYEKTERITNKITR
jgi:hypothetical protein